MDSPLIYFICTGNSARSQMAEGFARSILGERFTIRSGGLEPSVVNPYAIRVMAEVGVDISDQFSKPIDVGALQQAHVVVTLCGDAEERCPVVPASVRRLHWPLPDPAKQGGSEEERLNAFREVRDRIHQYVTELSEELLRHVS
jgi:arsenate reductase